MANFVILGAKTKFSVNLKTLYSTRTRMYICTTYVLLNLRYYQYCPDLSMTCIVSSKYLVLCMYVQYSRVRQKRSIKYIEIENYDTSRVKLPQVGQKICFSPQHYKIGHLSIFSAHFNSSMCSSPQKIVLDQKKFFFPQQRHI